MPLLALAITDDASRSALLSTHPIQGQQCAEAPLDPGGATKQLPTRRYLALEGGLTAEPAWAVERRRRRPQEHGWASQRAVARRGGPGGPDAGRAFVSLSTSSASVRCPVSGVRCPVRATSVHACLSTGPVSSVRCGRLSVQVSAVRRPVWASGVCSLPRPLCPAEVRSWSAAWAGRRTAGMAGVGVVAHCVHARLVVCLSRRLVSKLAQAVLGQPRRRFGPGRRRGRWLGQWPARPRGRSG
jgi:hypothetical protein